MSNKTAVIGFLGTTLDNGFNDKRWQRWRPTVSLALHDDLLVDELHVLYSKRDKRLFKIVVDDVARVSPQTEVIGHHVTLSSPWDFADVYAEQDNLVANHSIKSIQQVFTHCQVRVLAGTHFLLQTNPVDCWDAVAQELSNSTDCL